MRVKEWNDFEVWITAGEKKLAEEDIDLDLAARTYKSYLFTPHGIELRINIRAGARSPCTTDFVIQISFDGRPIHPIPLKRCDNKPMMVDGWIMEENHTTVKVPFWLGEIEHGCTWAYGVCLADGSRIRERFDDAMRVATYKEDTVGLIQIEIYKATLRKKTWKYTHSHVPRLAAHNRDNVPSDVCIVGGTPRPCSVPETRSLYTPDLKYKADGKTPWLSFVYSLRERPHDGEEWESKAIIRRQVERPEMLAVRQLTGRVEAMEDRLAQTIAADRLRLQRCNSETSELGEIAGGRRRSRSTGSMWHHGTERSQSPELLSRGNGRYGERWNGVKVEP